MCINKSTSFLVAHCSLELVKPNTRVNGEYLPLQCLQPSAALVSIIVLILYATYGTGRPTGAKRVQSCFTPMATSRVLWRETLSLRTGSDYDILA